MSAPLYFAHPTAVIDAGCNIGRGTKVWHFSHVMPGATIGDDCILGQNVFVASGAVIGNRVKIQNNVSVYDGVVLEDDVFCGPSCVFTNVLNPRSEIVRKHAWVSTLVRRGASIGANATIVCGARIGRYAFVGAGATIVRSDVPDYARMIGVPARRRGWVSRHGHTLGPVDAQGIACCPESGLRYQAIDGVLRCLDWPEEVAMSQPR